MCLAYLWHIFRQVHWSPGPWALTYLLHFFRISLAYLQQIFGILWCIFGIYFLYFWDIFGISIAYIYHIFQNFWHIFTIYILDIFGISLVYLWHILGISLAMSIYKVYSIGRTWSWPVMSAPACFGISEALSPRSLEAMFSWRPSHLVLMFKGCQLWWRLCN